MSDPSRVAVVGVTGYAGFELARLLLRHPHIEKTTFYLRDANAQRTLPHGPFPAAPRLGRRPLQAAIG